MAYSHSDDTRIVGCILAGGLSRRMGGGDKSLMVLAGVPLVARVEARLAPQVDHLIVNANGDRDRFAGLGRLVVADGLPDHPGPLAGLLAALDFAAAHVPAAEAVVTAPADSPLVPADLVSRLIAATKVGEAAYAASASGVHPVFGLWPLALAEPLRAFLGSGERRVLDFARRVGAREVRFPATRIGAAEVDPFVNINRPEDLANLEALMRPELPTTGERAVIGIAGWKNSGKTTLTARLVGELTGRGFRVSTVKHAHHGFDVDREGTDSWRHREAGAREVALVSSRRVVLQRELAGEDEPPLRDVLARLAPADIVLVEGYKREPIPKIEIRRLEAAKSEPLAPADPLVMAIVADHAVTDAGGLPVFPIDAVDAVADFLVAAFKLGSRR